MRRQQYRNGWESTTFILCRNKCFQLDIVSHFQRLNGKIRAIGNILRFGSDIVSALELIETLRRNGCLDEKMRVE